MCACTIRAENQLEQLLPGPVPLSPRVHPSFHSYHGLPTYFFQRKEFQSKDPSVVAAEAGLKLGGSAESLMERTGRVKGNLMDQESTRSF